MYNTNSASVGSILSLARNSSIEDFDHFTQSNILELERKMYDMFMNTERYNYLFKENPDIEINRLTEINNLLLSFVTKRKGAENWREYLKYFNSVLAVTSFYKSVELQSPLYSKLLLFGTALTYKVLNMYIESAMANKDYYLNKYDVYLSAISEAYKKSYISLDPIDQSKEPLSPRAKTIASTKTELVSIFEAFTIALFRAEKKSNIKIENLKETCLITCYINLFSAAISHIGKTREFTRLTTAELNVKSKELTNIIEELLIQNIEYMKNKYCCTTYDQDHKFNEKVSHFQFMKILSQVYQDGKGAYNKYTDQELLNKAFPEVIESMEDSIKSWVYKSLNKGHPTPASTESPVEICSPHPLYSRSIDSFVESGYLNFSGQVVERLSPFDDSKTTNEEKGSVNSTPSSIFPTIGFRSPVTSRSNSVDSLCKYSNINGIEEIESMSPSDQKESIDHFMNAAKLVRDPSTGRYLLMFTCIGLIVSSCMYSISFNIRFDIKNFEKYISILSGIVAFMLAQRSDDILESTQMRYNTLQESKKDLVLCIKNGCKSSSRIESYDLDRDHNKEKRRQIYYVIGATWSMLKHNYNMRLDSFYETDIAFMTMRMYISMIRTFEECNSIPFLANIEQLNGIAKNWSDVIYKNSIKKLDIFHPFGKYTLSLTSSLSVDSLYNLITEEIDIGEIRSKSDSIKKKWGDTLLLQSRLMKMSNERILSRDLPENSIILDSLQRRSEEDLLGIDIDNPHNTPYSKVLTETVDTTFMSSDISYAEEGRAGEYEGSVYNDSANAPIGPYTMMIQQERAMSIPAPAAESSRCIVM